VKIRHKYGTPKEWAEKVVKDIRRQTQRQFSAVEKSPSPLGNLDHRSETCGRACYAVEFDPGYGTSQ